MRKLTPVHYGVIASVVAIVLVFSYYFYVHGISLSRVEEPEPIIATTTEEAVFVPALAIDACGKEIKIGEKCATSVGKGRSVVLVNSSNELRIEEAGTGRRIQSISREQMDYFTTTLEYDIDFDGYLDLRIDERYGALDNVGASYWTFDTVTGGFKKHPVLNDISNPEFDPVNKEITTQSRCCAGGGLSRSTYSFLDGEYVLTYEFDHTESGGEEYDTPIDTERRLINGEMVETRTVVESWFTE